MRLGVNLSKVPQAPAVERRRFGGVRHSCQGVRALLGGVASGIFLEADCGASILQKVEVAPCSQSMQHASMHLSHFFHNSQ